MATRLVYRKLVEGTTDVPCSYNENEENEAVLHSLASAWKGDATGCSLVLWLTDVSECRVVRLALVVSELLCAERGVEE